MIIARQKTFGNPANKRKTREWWKKQGILEAGKTTKSGIPLTLRNTPESSVVGIGRRGIGFLEKDTMVDGINTGIHNGKYNPYAVRDKKAVGKNLIPVNPKPAEKPKRKPVLKPMEEWENFNTKEAKKQRAMLDSENRKLLYEEKMKNSDIRRAHKFNTFKRKLKNIL